jgi:hypothetical protein
MHAVQKVECPLFVTRPGPQRRPAVGRAGSGTEGGSRGHSRPRRARPHPRQVACDRCRSRRSTRLRVMSSAMRCGPNWWSVRRLRGGPVCGDGSPAHRSTSDGSAPGRCRTRRTGADSSRRCTWRSRWLRFVVVWCVASPTEARRGSKEPRNNSDWNRPFDRRIDRERHNPPNDRPRTRARPPFSPGQPHWPTRLHRGLDLLRQSFF